MKITKRKITIFIVLAALSGGGFVAWRTFAGGEQEPIYTTAEVKKGTLIVSVSGSGSIVTKNIAEIDPGISGEVLEVNVTEGDVVQKDQVLFKIKNDDLEAICSKAYVAYLQAKESLEKAKLDKLSAQEDLDELLEKDTNDPDSVSDLQIQIAKQKVRSAGLSIQSDENKVWQASLDYKQAKDEANKKEVKAPIAGTVTSLNVEVGDELEGKAASNTSSGAASGSSFLTIVDLENLVAEIDINEIDALNVKKDQKATLTFDVFAEERKFTGKVSKVDILGTTTQGVTTYKTEISLDSIEPTIKPGMTVSADIITESKESVLLVPNSAVKTSGEQNYVQILSESGVPQNISVEIGLASSQETEVISGLSEGDKVITTTSTQESGGGLFGGEGLRGIIPGGGPKEVHFEGGGGGGVQIMR